MIKMVNLCYVNFISKKLKKNEEGLLYIAALYLSSHLGLYCDHKGYDSF